MTYNEKVWFGVFAVCALFWCGVIVGLMEMVR